ncbi:hypothetical protein [Streptococcus suis]|uniref:hypothetical protein n=1 Tax=Streptococcus suis TaxID=1307 RepID=UPI0015C54171|nr:hypothetical protein [Streptococcus suis]
MLISNYSQPTSSSKSLRGSEIIFLCFLLGKPFYFLNSGGIQPSDILLIFSFIAFLYENNWRIPYDKKEKNYSIFLCCIILINLFYWGLYFISGNGWSFLLSTVYYLYNTIVILMCRQFFKGKRFIESLLFIVKGGIYLQFAFYGIDFFVPLSFVDASELRYIGTFNDPNQLGFFLLTSIFIIIILNRLLGRKENLFVHCLTLVLLFATSSTGIFLGFAFLYFFMFAISENKEKIIKQIVILVLAFFILFCLHFAGVFQFFDKIQDSFLYERVLQKFGRGFTINQNQTELSLIQERGIDRIILYPEYLLFGAGEGYPQRFALSGISNLEIHSTLFGLLFYYGFLPFIIFVRWIWINIRKSGNLIFYIFVPLMFESLTLANHRQPYFWMLFLLASFFDDDSRNFRKWRIVK